METVEGVAQRLNAKIMGSVQPMAEKAAVSAQNERRAKELRETLAQQQKRLQALQEPFKGLSKDQVAGLIRQAVKLRQEKQERAQQIKERFKAKRERERSDRSRGR
ncbi:TPA: mobilization domain protein [Escherichia coli]|nr:mobilization domain protein [Escherichia coli]HAL9224017.1 mobilization domain protein [Escherichia coli]HAL9877960.1 mobilization domain protein [Escherichia coli]HAL9878075.1 mobilization domain protein [Escherichia coli]